MNTPKEKFTFLIQEIVYKEMSVDQQTEYELEGPELIDRLLNRVAYSEEKPEEAKKLFMGVSPEAIEGIKVIAEFGGLLIACISLYLEIRSRKSQRINKKMEKIEAQRKLLDYMQE